MASWISPPPAGVDFEVPKLPAFIESLRQTINSVIDFLSSLLDVALAFLEIVRAFAIANINPILAIIDLVIAEIEQFFKELAEAGLYLTGDWWLLSPTCEGLVGGFREYERRMIARFTDKSDPTRPQIPSTTAAFAIFLYMDVDFSGIHTMAQFLNLILGLFSLEPPPRPSLPTPINLEVNYRQLGEPPVRRGFTEALLDTETGPIDVANVSWMMPQTSKNPAYPIPMAAPDGFLITVSTVKDGLQILYDRPLPNTPLLEDASGGKSQGREQGMVLGPDGKPLFLDGGDSQVEVDGLEYNASISGGGIGGSVVKKGASRVYARRSPTDNVPIPLEALKEGDRNLLQKSFYVSTADILGIDLGFLTPFIFTDVRYDIDLLNNDMPWEAAFEIGSGGKSEVVQDSIRVPDTVYVRVSAVTSRVQSLNDWRYVFRDDLMDQPGTPFQVLLPENQEGEQVTLTDRGGASEPLPISFPDEIARQFIAAITSSLALLVLSRSDLPVAEVGDRFLDGKAAEPTGLEQFGPLVADITGALVPSYFFEKTESSGTDDMMEFRRKLLEGCRLVASKMFSILGPTKELQAKVVEEAADLLGWKWSDTTASFTVDTLAGVETLSASTYDFPDTTILSSLSDTISLTGVCRNPWSSGLQQHGPPYPNITGRLPGFFQRTDGSGGSADYSPGVVVKRSGGIERRFVFVRNLVPEDVYLAAATVLSITSGPIARPPEDGQWIRMRLGDLIPGLDQLGDLLIGWLLSLRVGVEGILDAILALIDYVEARILELQALLKRINALVNILVTFRLPRFAALIVTGNGSDGVLQELISATNKPVDSPAASTARAQLKEAAAIRAAARQERADAWARVAELEQQVIELESEGKYSSADEARSEALVQEERAASADATYTSITTTLTEIEKTPLTYSAGAVLVGGGLPSIVVDLLSSFLSP